MITGRLNGLSIAANAGASVATYKLDIGSETLHLNPLLGQGLRFSWQPQYQCRNCEVEVPQVMRGGYCKRCFFALARCDSCFVSPARCHFALGSCREPDWGERVCMQGHFVYLANSSGIKVGLTQKGRQQQRWLAQGATQGLVIAVADTRRDAGMLEAAIAKIISDRTQWRRLVAMPPQQVQLQSLQIISLIILPLNWWTGCSLPQTTTLMERFHKQEQLRLEMVLFMLTAVKQGMALWTC